MIVPNVAFDIVVHLVILATGLPKTSGTIYAYVRRKSDGYWLKADGTWTASTTAPTGADVPTATHTKAGLWKLTLSNTTTNGLTAGEVLHAVAIDNETEASATVVSDCVEEVVHAVPLAPTTAGRALDVSVGGEIANVVGLTASYLDVQASTIPSLTLSILSGSMNEITGLLHKNSVIDSQTYDVSGSLLSARLRCYDSKSNLLLSGSGGLLHVYNVSASYGMYGNLSGTLGMFRMELQQ